ncbi:7275_t:CDS:2, partial [Gigaspora margarita]
MYPNIILANFVTFQFIPIPRYLQTSVLFNNSKWYFSGGIIGNNVDTNKTNEVVYLSLSSSFDTSSPLWNNSQIGSPLANALSSSFISIDMLSIFLIGGVMVDPKTQSSVSYQSAYKYNLNNLSLTVQNIEGINNFGICGGLQSINDEAGRIFFYVQEQVIQLLYLKNGNITYFGDRSTSDYINMNE